MERLGARHLGGRARLPVRPGRRTGRWATRRRTRSCGPRFFGATGGGPAAAPASPDPDRATILDEFRDRLAGGQMNAQHPRQFGYFTPPPLPVSMMGELLAQMTNQGVDVWHAGPLATFVEEEVVRWLCDLVGFERGVVRAAHLGRRDGQLHGHGPGPRHPPRPAPRVPAGRRAARCSRASASTPRTRPTSRSRGRSTCSGFPPETLVVIPSDERFRLHGAPVAEAVARDRAAGLTPVRDRGGRRLDEHRLGRPRRRAGRRRGGRGPVAPRRRGVRRRGAAVGARRGPRAGPRARGFGHRRPAQVVLPGLRHRRAAGPRRRAPGRRSSAAGRPSTTAAARRPRRRRRTPRTTTTRDQLNFYKLSFEGTRRWRALKLWMSWKHLGTDGLRPAHRGQRRPRRPPRPALRRVRRLRGDPGGARSSPSSASATCPAGAPRRRRSRPTSSTPTRIDSSAPSRSSGDGWLTTTRLRGATWLRAGIVNYLTTEADIDRLLAHAPSPG